MKIFSYEMSFIMNIVSRIKKKKYFYQPIYSITKKRYVYHVMQIINDNN